MGFLATTFYGEGTLGTPAALVAAAAIGLAFGFFLERAGFGSSRKLVSIFYLRDFAVFKVMFTAIVTAMLGIRLLSLSGTVDLGTWYQMETFLWPQIAAGLLFGVGFVMGGWCPGTAVVGVASGRGDAALFLGGAAIGSVAYAWAFPALADFAGSGACGVSTLPEAFGMSTGLIALLVVLMAIGAFVGTDRLVAWKARRAA